MSAMASQITSLTIVYLTVDSGTDQRKYQNSASLAFVRGIHRWPVNSPHKWPVKRKMFPFHDVIMSFVFCIKEITQYFWREVYHKPKKMAILLWWSIFLLMLVKHFGKSSVWVSKQKRKHQALHFLWGNTTVMMLVRKFNRCTFTTTADHHKYRSI